MKEILNMLLNNSIDYSIEMSSLVYDVNDMRILVSLEGDSFNVTLRNNCTYCYNVVTFEDESEMYFAKSRFKKLLKEGKDRLIKNTLNELKNIINVEEKDFESIQNSIVLNAEE